MTYNIYLRILDIFYLFIYLFILSRSMVFLKARAPLHFLGELVSAPIQMFGVFRGV